jgi:hypothetical protein
LYFVSFFFSTNGKQNTKRRQKYKNSEEAKYRRKLKNKQEKEIFRNEKSENFFLTFRTKNFSKISPKVN